MPLGGHARQRRKKAACKSIPGYLVPSAWSFWVTIITRNGTERNGIFREEFYTLFCGTERMTRASNTITIVGFSVHKST